MCKECPFRAKSAPGWLGPWTIEDFEQMMRADTNFICHMDAEQMFQIPIPDDQQDTRGSHCVGMLRYFAASGKLPRDPVKAAAVARLKEIKDQPVIPPGQFRKHHSRLAALPRKKKQDGT